MRHFTALSDVEDFPGLLHRAQEIKKNPFHKNHLGKFKTLGLVFFNASLRTRLSTQKAAQNLGLSVIVLNVTADSWKMETEMGVVMNADKAEHIKDAIGVMGLYCDIIGVRAFANLTDQEEDYSEQILLSFVQYAGIPVVSLESAIRHPLQSFADLITIEEYRRKNHPKVVLTWAPHPKALPQAVANSFVEWIKALDCEFVVTHPKGYELAPEFSREVHIEYDQNKALEDADFVYVKNWSSYTHYGQVLSQDIDWMVTPEKMQLTNQGYFMHCLPVRRNVVVSDAVIDGAQSLVLPQAANRVFSAQAVLEAILEHNF
ncbi:MAG: N-acetylornithine carbamoyltransferase [Microscillaceae bacterium]|nr:N-acetylornithine carbamoyltransferase [Microscillaceae bacterium]